MTPHAPSLAYSLDFSFIPKKVSKVLNNFIYGFLIFNHNYTITFNRLCNFAIGISLLSIIKQNLQFTKFIKNSCSGIRERERDREGLNGRRSRFHF